MKLHQLSLFLENRPGSLRHPCQVLASAGISMLALTLADTSDFGILRVIVKEWERAQKVLQEAGFVVRVTEVIAIDVPHKPGGLDAVLAVLEKAGQAIEYMYAFAGASRKQSAAMIFRFEDADAAISALSQGGINAIAPAELFQRLTA